MNSVKVVMGFLELAAAVKFLRAAELGLFLKADFFTYDLCVGIYVALCLACGLYLLNVYRLPHDHGAPESVGVVRLVCSLAFLSLGLYLMPGLFKDADGRPQKPRGVVSEWVRSFLLTDPLPPAASAAAGPEGRATGRRRPVWHSDLNQALAQAEKEGKPVFIDFTGLT